MNRKSVLLVMIGTLCAALLISCNKSAGLSTQAQELASWQEKYDLGMHYLSEGNYEEAIIAFADAIEIDSKQVLAYVGRGNAYVLSGDSDKNLTAALADYKEALTLDETLALAWLGLTDVYIRQGDYDQVLDVLRDGLEKTGNDQVIADKISEIEAGKIKDSSGNIRRMNGYDSAGKLAWYHIFRYNELGQKSAVTAYDAEGNQISYMELDYDEEGRILKQNDYLLETGEISGYSTYEYDSNGNRIKDTFCALDGTPEVYDIFEYDSDGRCINTERYDARDDRLQSKTTTEYDGEGKKIRENWSDYMPRLGAIEVISGYRIYEYNNDGKLIKSGNYHEDGALIHYYINHYDSDGNYLGQDLYNSDGELETSTVVES